tara:strand:+ start:429 stop:653 length:225 start_codon:yes stop_codon:yes gene_type:complete
VRESDGHWQYSLFWYSPEISPNILFGWKRRLWVIGFGSSPIDPTFLSTGSDNLGAMAGGIGAGMEKQQKINLKT